jgi:hypothetical protein
MGTNHWLVSGAMTVVFKVVVICRLKFNRYWCKRPLVFSFSSQQQYEEWVKLEKIDSNYALIRTRHEQNYKQKEYSCNRSDTKGIVDLIAEFFEENFESKENDTQILKNVNRHIYLCKQLNKTTFSLWLLSIRI